MSEPTYRVLIEYNPVTKQVQLQAKGVESDLEIYGVLELGRVALIRRAIQGAESRIELPAGVGPL